MTAFEFKILVVLQTWGRRAYTKVRGHTDRLVLSPIEIAETMGVGRAQVTRACNTLMRAGVLTNIPISWEHQEQQEYVPEFYLTREGKALWDAVRAYATADSTGDVSTSFDTNS